MVAMTATGAGPGFLRPLHPLHAILLAFPLPLFLGALLSDWAYSASFHIQWTNFAAWLNLGGLVCGGLVLLWALVDLIRGDTATRKPRGIYFVVLLGMCVLGFINALVHAKDAWASMPDALYLSAVTALLALVAAWLGYSGFQADTVQNRETR